jgi:MFS family permease
LVSDRFGRIAAMRVAALIWIVGSVTAVLVQNVEMLVIGRAVKGVTVGIFSSLLPVYVAEVIPSKKRGLATSVMQWCLTWGIMIMFYLSYSCTFLFDDDRSFRLAWGIELVPGSLLLFLSIFLPESPKWHASRSNWKKASDVMRKLNLEESDSSEVKEPSPVLDESPSNLNSIENVLDNFENYSQKCTYADLFRSELRPHLFTGMLTQIFTQLSGISVLMYYLIFICDMIGLTGEIKVISASIQYVINVLFTIFPIVFIDKIRRKDVLVYGAS